MKVHLTRVEGVTFEVDNGAGAKLRLEGSPELGGKGEALRPMEGLLASLAACSAVDVVKILSQQKEPLQGLEIFVEGKRADAIPAVFTEIHMRFVLHGPVADNKAHRAVDLAAEKYCSVGAMLGATCKLTHSVELVGVS